MTRVFESNGPDIKIRGTALHVAEKYVQLARDARSSGDPVAAENYYQHAEHYFRLIAAAQEQFRQNQPQPRTENRDEMAHVERWRRRRSEKLNHFGQEPGFVPQRQQQPVRAARKQSAARFPAARGRSAALPAPFTTHQQPREHHREPEREHRPQPQYQPQPPQPRR